MCGSGEERIQNTPEEGYGRNGAKVILSHRDKCPGSPSQAPLGLQSCLPVRDPQRPPFLSLSTLLTLCKAFQMCTHCLASIPHVLWDFLAHCRAATPPPNCNQRPFFPCYWFDANRKDLGLFFFFLKKISSNQFCSFKFPFCL